MNLADVLHSYIKLQQDTGRRFRADAVVLRAFGRAMGDVDLVEVDPAAVQMFLAGPGPVTAQCIQKHKILGSFYRFSLARGYFAATYVRDAAGQTDGALPPGVSPQLNR